MKRAQGRGLMARAPTAAIMLAADTPSTSPRRSIVSRAGWRSPRSIFETKSVDRPDSAASAAWENPLASRCALSSAPNRTAEARRGVRGRPVGPVLGVSIPEAPDSAPDET